MSLKPESTRFLTSSQPMPPAPTMSTRVVERSVPVSALVTSARDEAIVEEERKRSAASEERESPPPRSRSKMDS